ncbi:MAG: aspartate aminotransferase family protein [Pseudomonadota bacterium]
MSAVLPTYARADLAFVKGEGVFLETADGEKFLDFGAGIAVASLGHCHPALVEALTGQAHKLWHTSNLYHIPGQEKLADRLAAVTFADQTFFTNSGAEAMECTIKMARKYHSAHGNDERYRIITFEGAFHGRTLATISAGGQAKHLDGFGPRVEGFDQVPLNDIDAVRDAITDETAAIIIEPLLGEGGILTVPWKFFRDLRALADEHGLLLIFDEVQTGIGRTGRLFAHEWSGATPDIMAIAKGIGGGFPMGACLATKEAAVGMTAGTHGSTFGGNPLGMAVGNAVLDVVLEPGFLERVLEMGTRFKQKLASICDSHPDLFETIRGEGLMLGLKCKVPNYKIIDALYDQRLLAVPAGDNVVRMLPPLTVEAEHIDLACERLEAACATVSAAEEPVGA